MDVAAAASLERPAWVNVRTVLGALLFSIAVLTGWHVLGAADTGHQVWVAAADLPAGTKLTHQDLQVAEVDLPGEQLAHYLSGEVSLDGATLLSPLRAGELVPAAEVTEADRAATARLVTIPITADHAVGGALRRGDRVDVFASLAAGQPGARTTLLVAGAEVEDLVRDDGLVVDEDSLTGVTIEVSPQDAVKVAFAIRSAEIDIVRVEGDVTEAATASIRATDL